MEEAFREILKMGDVKGIMLFSMGGELLFKRFTSPLPEEPEKRDWWGLFIASLNGIREADLAFENIRLYIRKTEVGYLLILLNRLASMAMIRLNCDMILSSLKQQKASRGLGRFFKRQ